MYSVREFVMNIRNIQTKQKFLQILRKWNAANSSTGLIVRFGKCSTFPIY